MVGRPWYSPAEEEGFGLVVKIETSALANHGRQQSLLPELLLRESRARRCWHGPYIGVDAALVGGLDRMLQYFTVPFGSGCWAAPTEQFGSIVCRQHINFHVGVTAYEKFIHMLFTIVACSSPASFLNLESWNCENLDNPLATRFWGQNHTGAARDCHPRHRRLAHETAVASWNVAEETRRPLQKLHRDSVWKWLPSTWTMLASLTGRGWDGCRLPEPEERDDDATKWPCVGVVIDQGGDGWSACYMLDSWGCNIVGLHDPNHRIWTDCMLGIRGAGLHSWELVTQAVIGLDHGPWSTARWWAELKASAQEYTSISPSDCAIFSELWASIASELGVDVATVELDSSEKERVFRELGSAVESKFERVGMARWFGYAESMNGLLNFCWSSRLCILFYYLVMTGVPLEEHACQTRPKAPQNHSPREKHTY